MIKGIIFDFDGLICDTETPELKAWEELFRQYRKKFPLQEYLATIGSIYNDNTHVLILNEMLDEPIDAEQLMREFVAVKRDLIEQEPLRPGVLDYLQEAKEAGLRIGLASSAPDEWVYHHTKRLNVIEYFDSIKTAEDVARTKPDPELYLRTLECLQIQPHEAIALEDSPNGLSAALQAGVHVVVVPNSVTRVFNFDGAHMVMDSFLDMTLAQLIALLSERNK